MQKTSWKLFPNIPKTGHQIERYLGYARARTRARTHTHTHTHTHLLTVIVCFLCERKWGRGRGAPAPLKPRGSAPGTHVMNSMCWEMPACGTPQLGIQTQLLFDKIYEADRE